MILTSQRARVTAANTKMAAACLELHEPLDRLLARGCAHPLTTLGLAAGAGFVLGQVSNTHPLKLPGLGPLFSSGLAQLAAQGLRLFSDQGTEDAS